METLCKVDTIVLDKTGTLTEGIPVVVDSCWLTESNVCYLDILYTAELKSEHPLASAIIRWLEDSGASTCEAGNFESLTGRGIRMEVNGVTYWVGSHGLLEVFGSEIPDDTMRSRYVNGRTTE